jgi:hypothetical protein
MTLKRFVALQLAILFVLALGLYARAQVPVRPPDIISGTDIGFRVHQTLRGRAVGSLMVRVNGQWMEAWVTSRGGIVPLEAKPPNRE